MIERRRREVFVVFRYRTKSLSVSIQPIYPNGISSWKKLIVLHASLYIFRIVAGTSAEHTIGGDGGDYDDRDFHDDVGDERANDDDDDEDDENLTKEQIGLCKNEMRIELFSFRTSNSIRTKTKRALQRGTGVKIGKTTTARRERGRR